MQAQDTNKGALEEKKQPVKKFLNQVPEDIINNVQLNEAIKVLPHNYNFEIHKTIWRIRELKKTLNKDKLTLCLQFPEGLLLYACLISDIFENFTGSECIIMGDVTYGACCVDDLSADELGSDFIIHYGHSCLIPIDETCVKAMYVFVEISIDTDHFVPTIELNFPNKSQSLIIMGTIQFNTALFTAKKALEEKGYTNLIVPQEKPRSSGEVLGCTAPPTLLQGIANDPVVIFLCDGRFHMEAAMIANPQLKFYQYNPYTKLFTIEEYAHKKMLETRRQEIEKFTNIKRVGIILGILGRQGSTHILEKIETSLKEVNIPYIILLVSEIFDSQLTLFQDEVDIWVQIACPRISIDWGTFFTKPLITPYEFFVAMKKTEWKEVYPMDYYSNNGGEWTNYHHKQSTRKPKKNIVVQYEAAK